MKAFLAQFAFSTVEFRIRQEIYAPQQQTQTEHAEYLHTSQLSAEVSAYLSKEDTFQAVANSEVLCRKSLIHCNYDGCD